MSVGGPASPQRNAVQNAISVVRRTMARPGQVKAKRSKIINAVQQLHASVGRLLETQFAWDAADSATFDEAVDVLEEVGRWRRWEVVELVEPRCGPSLRG